MKVGLYLCGHAVKYSLGLRYLKSNCEQQDIKIDIVRSRDDLHKYDLIGLSVVSASNFHKETGLQEAVEILKSCESPVIVGGRGTAWDGLSQFGFRHVVVGEGEMAMKKLLRGDFDKQIIQEPIIEDIDSIKFPDRSEETESVEVLTSRGCPHGCAFCNSLSFWKKSRLHSVEYVIDDVKEAIRTNHRAKSIVFNDELFIFNKARLHELHRRWMQHGLDRRIQIGSLSMTPRVFDEEIGRMLQEMKVQNVFMGIETIVPRLQSIIKKMNSEERIQYVIDACNQLGIKIHCSFMCGLPGETQSDVLALNRFIARNDGKLTPSVFRFTPIPGSELYSDASYNGLDTMMPMSHNPLDVLRANSGAKITIL